MATLEELRYWCFGGDAPAETGTPLPDVPIFRAMAYRFAPERNAEFGNDYRRAAMCELPLSVESKRIAAAFRAAGVRFAPIKGADLAESCYPDPVLRARCDIDLLVRREDIAGALRIAEGEGWRSRHQYRNDNHCPSMYKKNAMLELHFNLPDFPPECSAGVWSKLVACGDTSEYRLPPELALVVAFHHARSHRWINSPMLIADYAFLLGARRDFDWSAARELAAEFGAADPGVLCFALPELFPAEVMPPGNPPPEKLRRALREAVLHPVNFQNHQDADVMNRGDRFTLAWWRDRLRGFAPSSVRIGYGLPDDAGFRRMAAAYCRMCRDKVKLVFRGIRDGNSETARALRRAEFVEKELSKLSR